MRTSNKNIGSEPIREFEQLLPLFLFFFFKVVAKGEHINTHFMSEKQKKQFAFILSYVV